MTDNHKISLPVSIRQDLADALEIRAKEESRKLSAVLERCVGEYLTRELPPVQSGAKVTRARNPEGYRIRRYMVTRKTIDALNAAETAGYSKAYLIEEALKVGLGVTQ